MRTQIEPIPEPYLFQLETPLIIFHGRLFQPSAVTTSSDNYLELGPQRYSLEEICTPKILENLYFLHHNVAFEGIQSNYIQKNLKKDIVSKSSFEAEIKGNKVLSFIVNQVLPMITARRMEEDISNILSEDLGQDKENARPRERQNNLPGLSIERATPQNYGRAITGEVQREVQRIKKLFLEKIDEEYGEFVRIKVTGRRDDERSIRKSIDDTIFELLTGKTNENAQPAVERDYSRRLEDGSILNSLLLPENIMIIEGKAYDIITIKEYIQIFKSYMSPALYSKLQRYSASSEPGEVIQTIRQSIFEIEKKYRSRIRNKIRESKLKINGSYYLPIYRDDSQTFLSELSRGYKKLIERKLKAEAFDTYENQARELYAMAEEKHRLEQLASKNQYEENGAGFLKHNGQYYVYVTTARYALRSPHITTEEKYLVFEPAKIGVMISSQFDNSIEISDPVIMHAYKHPFLGSAEAYRKICLGERGFDATNRFRRLSPEQAVINLLDQGKKTLLMGYRTGSNPYLRLSREYWSGPWLTKKEIEKKGIVCLNDR